MFSVKNIKENKGVWRVIFLKAAQKKRRLARSFGRAKSEAFGARFRQELTLNSVGPSYWPTKRRPELCIAEITDGYDCRGIGVGASTAAARKKTAAMTVAPADDQSQ